MSFGCHPCVYVAIERAISELFQGYNKKTICKILENDYYIANSHEDVGKNLFKIYQNGRGKYPFKFIWGKYPEIKIPEEVGIKKNAELLNKMIKYFKNKGYKIFVSKGYYLGLESYHVIIPGVSEARYLLQEKKIVNNIEQFAHVNLKNIEKSQIDRVLLYFLNKYLNDNQKFVVDILNYNIYEIYGRRKTTLHGICTSMLISMLYIIKKDWKNAYIFMNKYIDEIQPSNPLEELIYYKKIVNILKMLDAGWSDKKIKEEFQFCQIEIQSFLEMLMDKEKLLDGMPDFSQSQVINENMFLQIMVNKEIDILKSVMRKNYGKDID